MIYWVTLTRIDNSADIWLRLDYEGDQASAHTLVGRRALRLIGDPDEERWKIVGVGIESPLHQRRSDTSRAAAAKASTKMGKREHKMLALLASEGGMIDDEIRERMRLHPNSVRPIRRRLVVLGKVRDSKIRRTNELGNPCTVWEAVRPPAAARLW